MKDMLHEIPIALKKQILKRIGIGIFFAVISVITWAVSKEFLFVLPGLTATVFFIINGVGVLFATITKKYVVLSGECESLDQTRLMKRTKAAYLVTDYGEVKIPIRNKLRRLQIGSQVRCYISLKTSVYEYDGVQIVSDYYAVEIVE